MDVMADREGLLTAASRVAWESMGRGTRAALLRAMAAGMVHYGHNVNVRIPAGPAANEIRKLAPDLLAARAILRAGDGEGHWASGGFTFLAHREMVQFVTQETSEGRRFAAAESTTRMMMLSRRLHAALVRSLPAGTHGRVTITIADAASPNAVGARATVGEGSRVRELSGFILGRDALTLVRAIIAPRNLPSARVSLCLTPAAPRALSMRVNSFCIGPVKATQTGGPAGGAAA